MIKAHLVIPYYSYNFITYIYFIKFSWKYKEQNKNTILMRMVFIMVEARGFEPLSEDYAT